MALSDNVIRSSINIINNIIWGHRGSSDVDVLIFQIKGKNRNKWVEKHNECRFFHTGALHATINIQSYFEVDSDFRWENLSDFERGFILGHSGSFSHKHCVTACSLQRYGQKVKWSDESFCPIFSSGWMHTHLAYTKRTLQALMFDPYSEGIQWLCYAVGDIMLAWFRSACWGKGYYKTKQSCSDHYPMMKHF